MQAAIELTQTIKALAIDAGFDHAGIAPATLVSTAPGAAAAPGATAAPFAASPYAAAFRRWLAMGYHADMTYMAANLDKRLDPTKLVEGAKSVICLVASYPSLAELVLNPQSAIHNPQSDDAPIALFARGPDYHKLLKKRCKQLMDAIRRIAPDFAGRAFCDSAPVMERTLAASAGLGWIGRNGCLIVPGLGSYVVLAEIISNLPLVIDHPIAPQCGQCRLCLAACPTGALAEIENIPGAAPGAAVPGAMPPRISSSIGIFAPLRFEIRAGMSSEPSGHTPTSRVSLIDCRECISYLTIEHKGQIPPQLRPAMGQSIFGCDRCQQACPHNRGVPGAMPPQIPPFGTCAGMSAPVAEDMPARISNRSGAKIPMDDEIRGGMAPAGILQWTPDDWDLATRGSTIRRTGYQTLLRNAIIAAGNSHDARLIEPLERLARREPQLAELSQWAIERITQMVKREC